MEIRTSRTSTSLAVINFSSATMADQIIELDASKFKGIKSFYFVVTAAENFYVDAWQFIEVGAAGIQPITNTQHLTPNTQTYDLSGRRLSDNQQHHGIVIKNGKKIWR